MPVIAKLRNLNIAPRKVRLIVDLIRGKKVKDALPILRFAVKKASDPLLKLLNSAIANAKNNFSLDEKNLYISKITVDEGRKMKRYRPRARGVAGRIQKKTSHVTILLDEIEKSGKKVSVKESEKTDTLTKKATDVEGVKATPKRRKTTVKEAKPKAATGQKRVFRRQTFSK